MAIAQAGGGAYAAAPSGKARSLTESEAEAIRRSKPLPRRRLA